MHQSIDCASRRLRRYGTAMSKMEDVCGAIANVAVKVSLPLR